MIGSRVLRQFIGQSPYLLLLLLAVTFPLDVTWFASGVADASWTTVRLEVAVLVGSWLIWQMVSLRKPHIPSAGITTAAALMLVVLLLCAWMAPSQRIEAIKSWVRLASGPLVALAVFDLTHMSHRWRIVGSALGLGGTIVAVLGLLQAAAVQPVMDWLQVFQYGPVPASNLARITSTLPHPNIAAMVLELSLPFALVWTCSARSTPARLLLGAATLAMGCALLLTFSRAGLVACMLGLGILAIRAPAGAAARRKAWLGGLGVAAVGVGLMVVPAALNPQLLARFAEESALATYHASYVAPSTASVRPGTVEPVPIRLSNQGETVWSATGARRFGLGYHVWGVDGSAITYDGEAAPLPADVPPGATVVVVGRLSIPAPGMYRIQWDAIQEGVAWFSWTGTESAWTTVTVDDAVWAGDGDRAIPAGAAIVPPQFSRIFAWTTAWRMLLDRPLLGVGPDNYRWRFRDYAGLNLSDIGVHAHNIYLEWLADGGVLGFAACAWFVVQLWRAAARGLASADGGASQRLWRFAAIAALVAWFAHGLLDDFFRYTPTFVAFWIIVGLALPHDDSPAELRRRT